MEIKGIKVGPFILGLILFGLFPSISKVEMAKEVLAVTEGEISVPQDFERVVLRVEGMTCRKCVKPLKKALLKIPGVKKADVSYLKGKAVVEFEKGRVTGQQLEKAIEDQSTFFYTYRAEVVEHE